MHIGTAHGRMASASTPHFAVCKPDRAERDNDAWFVSWLPGHRLTRGQAMVAMLVAEHVAQHHLKPGMAIGMSLPLSEALLHGWLQDLPVPPDLERIVTMVNTAEPTASDAGGPTALSARWNRRVQPRCPAPHEKLRRNL